MTIQTRIEWHQDPRTAGQIVQTYYGIDPDDGTEDRVYRRTVDQADGRETIEYARLADPDTAYETIHTGRVRIVGEWSDASR